ncbi:alpha/beta hydrolase [Salipiger marinus]|uniref:Acetyl esterase n=1 Tax=Salipiger marinus TaxID=555512 RepID=A0A1G8M1C9_9RHOB|nr:alpha/beta hydrolase [Salipiger marinus]SDI61190.1 acetyl esterase [Salipiger marinus]
MSRPPLSPGARATLAAQAQMPSPPFEQMSAPEARASFDAGWPALQLPPDPALAEGPVPLLLADRPALCWRGAGAPATGARAILYLHGGGWVVGSPASHAAICQRLAAACGAVVICPDYRLAPEHPFPAAAEDAIACLAALPQVAAQLGLAPDRIIVAGDSAGGNLAAVAALAAARDPALPQPRAQLLFYPNTDAGQTHLSYRRFAEGFGLSARTMRWFRDHYARPEDHADWRLSPLRADPAGTAPAFVALAGADILHDEGRAYAEALTAAGTPVETRLWEGHLHGFLSHCRHDPAALEALAAAAQWLDRQGI